MRVALATCAEVPELDEDGPALVAALAARGIDAVPAVWDADVEWTAFELVVLRSTWDYAERRGAFLDWLDTLPRVLNARDVVRWNTDKHYLRELAAAGVPVVETAFVSPGAPFDPPPGPFVVKPAISAGSRRTASYDGGDVRAREHVRALHAAGDVALVQPYLERVDAAGETALLYIGGRYSHAVGKAALLRRGAPPASTLYLEETIERREPADAEVAVAGRVLAAIPFDADELLYARIDLVPGETGPLVLEVELTEPSLFLGYADGAAERLAEAIERAL